MHELQKRVNVQMQVASGLIPSDIFWTVCSITDGNISPITQHKVARIIYDETPSLGEDIRRSLKRML